MTEGQGVGFKGPPPRLTPARAPVQWQWLLVRQPPPQVNGYRGLLASLKCKVSWNTWAADPLVPLGGIRGANIRKEGGGATRPKVGFANDSVAPVGLKGRQGGWCWGGAALRTGSSLGCAPVGLWVKEQPYHWGTSAGGATSTQGAGWEKR